MAQTLHPRLVNILRGVVGVSLFPREALPEAAARANREIALRFGSLPPDQAVAKYFAERRLGQFLYVSLFCVMIALVLFLAVGLNQDSYAIATALIFAGVQPTALWLLIQYEPD